MVIIANPIYDSVFKFLMEDERVARIMLSALLKKDVVKVEMRPHEYTGITERKISMMRIDFSATIRDNDGSTHLVLIELQKTWLATETLRFRQYLATQYNDSRNISDDKGKSTGYGIPIISIYILGHKLGSLEEPIVYIRRNYYDYDNNTIVHGVPDPFVESLTHDSVIVQIPYLKRNVRNRLEKLMQIFDQEYRLSTDIHMMEIDETNMDVEEMLVISRLVKAVASPKVRRSMDIEDEILSEIESRDTTIMQKNKEIEIKDKEIQSKDKEIQSKDKEIDSQRNMLSLLIKQFTDKGMSLEDISKMLDIPSENIKDYINRT